MASIKDGIALGKFPAPRQLLLTEDWISGYRTLRSTIVSMLGGRLNSTGEITIIAGDSPVTVNDLRVSESSVIVIMIGTSDLATNFLWWISAVSNGSFVFEFTYNGQLSSTLIRYVIIG